MYLWNTKWLSICNLYITFSAFKRSQIGTALVMAVMIIFFSHPAAAKQYYVSSEGNDDHDGLSESAPIKTISKVQSLAASGDVFLFRRGDIFRGQLDIVNGKVNITLSAYGSGDNPVISGSSPITGWSHHQGNIYWADVSDIAVQPVHLFANGKLMRIARHPNVDAPNSGWLQVVSSSDKKTFTDPAIAGKPNDYFKGATVRIRTFSWLFETRTVTNSTPDGTITLSKDLTQTLAAAIQPGWGYYLDNQMDFLDHENEWYYNPTEKRIYLWAPGGVDPNTLTIEAAIYSIGVKLFWKCHDVQINNITFRHQTQDGIYINQCDRVSIRNCRFENCIQKGVNVSWNSVDFTLENNVFDQCLNYAAVVNGNIAAGNSSISGNIIRDTALVPGYGGDGVTQSIAIRLTGTSGVTIRNNTIDNTGYAAVILEGGGHVVEKNTIRKSQLTLDDGGAIMVNSHNNQIRSNFIAESWGNRDASSGTNNGTYFRQMGMGIFFLPKITGTIIENNTIANNTDFGIYPDRAVNTIIRNNVCYNNRYQLYLKGQTGDVTDNKYGNTIEGNTFYSLSPNQFCLRVDDTVDFGTFDRNRYCNPYSDIVIKEDNSTAKIPVYSLERWKIQHPDRDQTSKSCSVSLQEYSVSNPRDNLIINSFFTDSISGWTEVGDGKINWDNSKTEMDGGCLKYSYSGTADARVYPNKFTIRKNQFYRLTFSSFANAYGNLRVVLYNEDIGGAWVEYVERFFALKPTRTDFTYVFQWTFADSGTKPYFITTSKDPSVYWVDTVVLEPVDAVRIDPKTTSVLFTNLSDDVESRDLGIQKYFDLDGNTVSGMILLQPFESKILIPDFRIVYYLQDCILILQILSGFTQSADSFSTLDINKNGKLDLEDCIGILQIISGK